MKLLTTAAHRIVGVSKRGIALNIKIESEFPRLTQPHYG
jgi:hypothetical protein